jgi:hypothetical protein
LNYKTYFRKSSFKKDAVNAKILIDLISKYKPKNFLEVGVLEGVTARNVCELLYSFYQSNFRYIGIDLFGLDKEENNLKEFTPISNKYSNPLKYIYFNLILRNQPNDIDGVRFFLRKFKHSTNLHKGYSKDILGELNLSDIDFCFLDGGHAYNTVKSDLSILFSKLKKGSIILVDDYNQINYGVKKAVDEIKNKFKYHELGRFMLLKKI